MTSVLQARTHEERRAVLREIEQRVLWLAACGAENPVMSCDMHVLVDDAAEPVSSERPDDRAGVWSSTALGRALMQ